MRLPLAAATAAGAASSGGSGNEVAGVRSPVPMVGEIMRWGLTTEKSGFTLNGNISPDWRIFLPHTQR